MPGHYRRTKLQHARVPCGTENMLFAGRGYFYPTFGDQFCQRALACQLTSPTRWVGPYGGVCFARPPLYHFIPYPSLPRLPAPLLEFRHSFYSSSAQRFLYAAQHPTPPCFRRASVPTENSRDPPLGVQRTYFLRGPTALLLRTYVGKYTFSVLAPTLRRCPPP